jgi:hypothetical protein
VNIIDRILRRRSFYRAAFATPAGRAVLADLARFCHDGKPPLVLDQQGRTDLYMTGMEAGRQVVLRRIVEHLHIDDAQLLRMKEAHDAE